MPSFYKAKSGWVKECSNCKVEYHAQGLTKDDAYKAFRKNFSPRRNAHDGLESGCYRCRAIADMRIRFGIDVEVMLKAQDDKCGICADEIQFNTGSNAVSACVDHDHITGETRGILCRRCNLGLGGVDKDEWLTKAIVYRDLYRG